MVRLHPAPGQVRRDAEVREPKIDDIDIAHIMSERSPELFTAQQSKKRERIVIERPVVDEGAFAGLQDALVIPAKGYKRPDDCSNAGATNCVNRYSRLADCSNNSNMCEAASAAGAQHEGDGMPRKQSG